MEEQFEYISNVTVSPCVANNITEDFDSESKTVERIVAMVVPTVFAFIVAFGFVGNLLVIIVVLSNKQMRNTTNVLITNLAVTDLAFIIICVPFTAVRYSVTVWEFGQIWCKFIHFIIYCTAWASIYTLVFMSVDRYLAVVHAVSATSIRTPRNATVSLVIMWCCVVLINIPTWMSHDLHDYYYYNLGHCEKRVLCRFRPGGDNVTSRVQYTRLFYTSFLVFGFLLPLFIICILYGFMLHRLLYGVPLRKSSSSKTAHSKKRVTRLILIVVSFFTACWLPLHVMLMRMSYYDPKKAPVSVGEFVWTVSANVLAFINSCVNPIIYAFLSKHFRYGFKKILFCKTLSYSHGITITKTSATKKDLPSNCSRPANGGDKGQEISYQQIDAKPSFTTAL